MNKVIEILESMGSNAELSSLEAVDTLLTKTEIHEEQSKAIITKDVTSLERQLDICPDIYCLLLPADDEEEKDSETDQDNTETNSVING